MSNRTCSFGIGLAIGAALGITAAFIYSPKEMRETGKMVENKILGLAARVMANVRWLSMTPRERYTFLWQRGGSLHDWRTQYPHAQSEIKS